MKTPVDHDSAVLDALGSTDAATEKSPLLHLWRALSILPGPPLELRSEPPAATMVEQPPPGTVSPSPSAGLAFFYTAFARALRSSGDDVLPLPLDDTLKLLSTTRSLLYRLLWADAAAVTTPLASRDASVIYLLSAATEAFNALFERHSRNPICADSEWLWPALPASELTADVILGLAGARERLGQWRVGYSSRVATCFDPILLLPLVPLQRRSPSKTRPWPPQRQLLPWRREQLPPPPLPPLSSQLLPLAWRQRLRTTEKGSTDSTSCAFYKAEEPGSDTPLLLLLHPGLMARHSL
jgi:hypothetical protein